MIHRRIVCSRMRRRTKRKIPLKVFSFISLSKGRNPSISMCKKNDTIGATLSAFDWDSHWLFLKDEWCFVFTKLRIERIHSRSSAALSFGSAVGFNEWIKRWKNEDWRSSVIGCVCSDNFHSFNNFFATVTITNIWPIMSRQDFLYTFLLLLFDFCSSLFGSIRWIRYNLLPNGHEIVQDWLLNIFEHSTTQDWRWWLSISPSNSSMILQNKLLWFDAPSSCHWKRLKSLSDVSTWIRNLDKINFNKSFFIVSIRSNINLCLRSRRFTS